MPDLILGLGEVLSKSVRHELCVLCLAAIQRELNKKEEPPRRGRGRPQSAATVLAARVGVTYDSIKRWTDLSKIQSCDSNATKLAQAAFEYDPEETIKILRVGVERHREAVEGWISQRTPLVEPGIPDLVAEVEEGA